MQAWLDYWIESWWPFGLINGALCTALGSVVLWGGAAARRWWLRRQLKGPLNDVHRKLRVCADSFVEARAGSETCDLANGLIGRLRRAGYRPPDACTTDPDQMRIWFKFLDQVRSDLS